MAKGSGLGDQLYVGGYDVGGSINSLQRIAGGNTPIGMTDITQSAEARAGGQRDGGFGITSYFDPAAGATHERFSALPTGDVIATYAHGSSIGGHSASCVGKQIDYAGNRAQDGSFLQTVDVLANKYGLEWGRQLTAGKRTDTAAANGASLDLASVSPGAFGAHLYVQLFAFTGTSVTLKVQQSSDDGAGDAFADVAGLTTAALTDITAVRIAVTELGVERYVRLVSVGTFTEAIFFAQFERHLVELEE